MRIFTVVLLLLSLLSRRCCCAFSANNIDGSIRAASASVSRNDDAYSSSGRNVNPSSQLSRRNALASSFLGISTSAALLMTNTEMGGAAWAFSNRISTKYDDRPKRRGSKPGDLGVGTRLTMDGETKYAGLKPCGPAPNCFSSTIPVEDDPEHSIPAWVWPSRLDKESAMKELLQVLKSYPPGQSNVDGGGFEIQVADTSEDGGYIYVQYESLKNGFIDDVEFAVIDTTSASGDDKTKNIPSVQIRSSSRIGYLDFGVNAKRLNWIAKALRSKGWDAPGVDYVTHPFYASENEVQEVQ